MYFFSYISLLFWPIAIGVIIWRVVHARNSKKAAAGDESAVAKSMNSQIAVSKEDALSQLFLVLGVVFVGVTLIALNREIGDPVGWRWIVFVTTVIAMAGAYWQRAVGLLIIGIAGIVTWFSSMLYLWSSSKSVAGAASFVALALLAVLFFTIGRLHESFFSSKRFALVYSGLGLLSVTGILFMMSTQIGIGLLQEMAKGAPFSASGPLATVLFVLTIAILGTAFAGFGKKLFHVWEIVAVVLLTLLFGSSLLISQGTTMTTGYSFFGSSASLTGDGVMWAVIYNIAIFVELVALIFAGYTRKEQWMVNLGTLCLFLLIFVKYFDWFFSFMDKSVFFIGAGILLFLLGWGMEKGRRYTLDSMKAQTISQLSQ